MAFSLEEFCQGYFHVDRCYEWQQKTLCLFKNPGSVQCSRHGVRALVHLNAGDETLFLKQYTNISQGWTEKNIHVEEQFCSDPRLEQILDSSLQATDVQVTMTVYMTYQPCHQSGGGRNLQRLHRKSCTNVLLNFLDRVTGKQLTPNFRLRLKLFGLYRVHWENADLFKPFDKALFGGRVNQASEGLAKLLLHKDPKIEISMMDKESWREFLSLIPGADELVQETVSVDQWALREAHEQRCQDFLDRFRGSCLQAHG